MFIVSITTRLILGGVRFNMVKNLEDFMVFGYWAIFTAVICLVGFTYMTVLSFSEDPVDAPKESSKDGDSNEVA